MIIIILLYLQKLVESYNEATQLELTVIYINVGLLLHMNLETALKVIMKIINITLKIKSRNTRLESQILQTMNYFLVIKSNVQVV